MRAFSSRVVNRIRFIAGVRSFRSGFCPACGASIFVKAAESSFGIRCLRCGMNLASLSLWWVLVHEVPNWVERDIYEIGSRSAFARHLRRHSRRVTCSQYFDDAMPGEVRGGVRSEDVQGLTFPDASFDVCTSSEVFEHVADDGRAFREIHRVLRPGGHFLFTVPLNGRNGTIERARLTGTGIEHLAEPAYHDDPIRGPRSVLAFRDYGFDILDRLLVAGFRRCGLRTPRDFLGWGHLRQVISAHR